MNPTDFLETIQDREGNKVETRTTWLGKRVIWYFYGNERQKINEVRKGDSK